MVSASGFRIFEDSKDEGSHPARGHVHLLYFAPRDSSKYMRGEKGYDLYSCVVSSTEKYVYMYNIQPLILATVRVKFQKLIGVHVTHF